MLIRIGVGVAVASVHMVVLNIPNDTTRAQIGLIWPLISFTIWQILISVVRRRAEKKMRSQTIDSIVQGEQTLDLLLSAYDQRAARRGSR